MTASSDGSQADEPGASEECFRQVAEAATDVVWRIRIRPDFAVEYVSPSMKTVTGWAPQEFYTDPDLFLRDVVHPDDREGASRVAETGEIADGVTRWRRRDGTIAWMDVRRFLIRDTDGSRIAVAGIARDISERVAAEDELNRARQEAEEANRAKSEFLSRMSHELRTPLNSVVGFAELLEAEDLSEDQRESVSYILKGGRHLTQLIDEVLDIARIEGGNLSLSMGPVRVCDVLADALDLCRSVALERRIEIDECPPEVCDRTVMADRRRLTQVFVNLFSNAVKYNRPGGSVSLHGEDREGGRLAVKITDTGWGIPEDKLGRVFTPFDRLGAEHTEIEGTGLGLALAKHVLEAMGGRIDATSVPGAGSTFWVELPLLAEAPRGAGHDDQPDLPPAASFERTPRRLLYVEDDPASAQLVRRILGRRPEVAVTIVDTGQGAIDLVREATPDIVLLDVNLPDMGGEEVLSQIVAVPGREAIPVVVISADATPAKVSRLLEAGACHYLTKPVAAQRLLTLLDEVFLSVGPRRSQEAAPTGA